LYDKEIKQMTVIIINQDSMMVAMLAMSGLTMLAQFPIMATSFIIPKTTYPPPTVPNSQLQRRRQTLRMRTELFAVEQKDHISTENVSNKEAKEIFIAAKDDLCIGKNIGAGSYGTVHLLQSKTKQQSTSNFVGKRPWRYEELLLRKREKAAEAEEEENDDVVAMEERAVRCMYYWRVEQHCFTKLPPHPQLPLFLGTSTTRNDKEKDDNEWMVFRFVGEIQQESSGDEMIETPVPAQTLQDLMRMELKESTLAKHELRNIAEALDTTSYEETLDTILPSLLVVLQHIHKNKIVHRDIKPANLLVHDNNLLLMDFGSAADLEPSSSSLTRSNGLMSSLLSSQKQRVGLESGNRVAVSPVYAAPEVFIDIHDAPTSFDIFSSGLIFCQLLFGYLEERVDAGFRQQLVEDADCDLNVWLNNELSSKLRPAGLDQALDYLIERKGLWDLLAEMLSKEPRNRPSARKALQRWHDIQSYREGGNDENENINANNDHSFFSLVVEALETCEIPSISRPLHFVSTFSRSRSLGLVLSEKDEDADDSDNDSDNYNEENQILWKAATKDSFPGEVFVKDIVTDGQADELGIFEIGDRLSGIGELPFIDGGFEKAVGMLQDQPKATKNVRLHFDRTSVRFNEAIDMKPPQASIRIADRGAWSSKGRRKAQEDTFILHEIHDVKDRSVLVGGVMDGHGGTSASQIVSEDLPSLLSNQLVIKDRSRSVCDALEDSWISICKTYQQNCLDDGECIAEYDPMEGILQADTGSKDLKAGTTCSMMALDETSSELTLLNCGDSRSLVVSEDGKVKFATLDHTPQSEEERLLQGIQQGLDYSLPKCRLSRWSLKVGDYEYAVGRSLEGVFATSKGIVSDPDVSTLTVQAGEILVSATDGLWNVMDSNEVAMDLYKMRIKNGMSAHDAASTLCSMAIRKGSSDNVSAVVVYL
jgi:serine/threonine protein phosphatase PrpC/serine/threonine protein kinase